MPVSTEQARNFGQEQLQTKPPENGVVIIYRSSCSHCQHSLENTRMPNGQFATHTSNGTPVKWIDVDTPEGLAQFQSLNGIRFENGNYRVGGTTINAVPTTIAMQNGVATEVLKTGVLQAGDLNMFAAMLQARSPSQSPATGNTVPYNTAPQPVVGAQR